MEIIYQSIVMGALVTIAATLIVFTCIFLTKFSKFAKSFEKEEGKIIEETESQNK